MMNPVSASVVAAQSGYGVQQAASKPPQSPQQQPSWPQDKVTIKGTSGAADHDGDRT